jgi:hypothetical protein
MQPLHVDPIDFQSPDSTSLDVYDHEPAPVSRQVEKAIEKLRNAIFKFKKNLFEQIVNHDTKHNAADLGAMMTFHALFLQCISYWISLLDSSLVPEPQFAKESNSNEFKSLKEAITKVAESSPDARIHLYQLLFRFGQQHPFDLGAPEELV